MPEARHSRTLLRASPAPMGLLAVPIDFSHSSSRGWKDKFGRVRGAEAGARSRHFQFTSDLTTDTAATPATARSAPQASDAPLFRADPRLAPRRPPPPETGCEEPNASLEKRYQTLLPPRKKGKQAGQLPILSAAPKWERGCRGLAALVSRWRTTSARSPWPGAGIGSGRALSTSAEPARPRTFGSAVLLCQGRTGFRATVTRHRRAQRQRYS